MGVDTPIAGRMSSTLRSEFPPAHQDLPAAVVITFVVVSLFRYSIFVALSVLHHRTRWSNPTVYEQLLTVSADTETKVGPGGELRFADYGTFGDVPNPPLGRPIWTGS